MIFSAVFAARRLGRKEIKKHAQKVAFELFNVDVPGLICSSFDPSNS